MYKFLLKRILDILVSIILLIISLPVLLFVVIALLVANNGKPFFFQVRPGKDAKLFKIVKFKTMTDQMDSKGNLLSDEQRLTKVGLFVRKSSLDELPQLFNVLVGEMSLIGPRPLLPEYLSLYNENQARRHRVRPGITGWAQINGRNAISWDQKFKLDIYYVENLSFWLDLKIILLTIKKVLVKEGISSGSSVTMEKFTGN